jgi:hypothetical protein
MRRKFIAFVPGKDAAHHSGRNGARQETDRRAPDLS